MYIIFLNKNVATLLREEELETQSIPQLSKYFCLIFLENLSITFLKARGTQRIGMRVIKHMNPMYIRLNGLSYHMQMT